MQYSKCSRFSKSNHQQHKPFGCGAWLCLFLLCGSRGPLRCTDSQQRSTRLIINQILANCAACVNIHQLLMFFDCPIFWIPERENRIIDFPIIDDLSVLKLLYWPYPSLKLRLELHCQQLLLLFQVIAEKKSRREVLKAPICISWKVCSARKKRKKIREGIIYIDKL